jgi:hypothetical protein
MEGQSLILMISGKKPGSKENSPPEPDFEEHTTSPYREPYPTPEGYGIKAR